jgi:LysM repeat protein
MTHPHQPENIKICPACGTCLIVTARRCAACGYVFTAVEGEPPIEVSEPRSRGQPMQVTISLPALLGLVIIFVSMSIIVVLGLQKREQTRTLVDAEEVTSTFIATSYVSPTPLPTATRTPAPPTVTPEVEIEYTVASGDSCLSVARKFHLMLDSLLSKNRDIDCSLLPIGTVLTIPNPTATPETPNTPEATSAAP